jgi:hypothetical protein
MSHEKLKVAVARINELRYRLEPVEQHWAWTAEQLHGELRHVLHTLNGLVSLLSVGSRPEAAAPQRQPAEGPDAEADVSDSSS